MNQMALTSIHGTLRENISVTEAPTILNLYDLTKKKHFNSFKPEHQSDGRDCKL